jgi:uncharacterized coiled-coil protein SlyX
MSRDVTELAELLDSCPLIGCVADLRQLFADGGPLAGLPGADPRPTIDRIEELTRDMFERLGRIRDVAAAIDAAAGHLSVGQQGGDDTARSQLDGIEGQLRGLVKMVRQKDTIDRYLAGSGKSPFLDNDSLDRDPRIQEIQNEISNIALQDEPIGRLRKEIIEQQGRNTDLTKRLRNVSARLKELEKRRNPDEE